MSNKILTDEELDEVNGGFCFFGKKTQTKNVQFSAATRTTPTSSCDKFEKKADAGVTALSVCKNCKYFHAEGTDSGVCNNSNKGTQTQTI